MPQRFSPCITQHTAYINCAFVLRVQRWLFLCKDLIGLIMEFYRLGEHASVFFFFFFYKHISEALFEFMLNWGCSRAQVCVLWFLSQ